MTGAGPSPFPTKRLKYLAPLRRSTAHGNHERPYVGLENVAPWTGHFTGDIAATSDPAHPRTPASPTEAPSRSPSNMFEPGDVLFGKLRPYLAKAWVAQFSGRSTTEFLIMRPVDAEPRFLRYVCLSRPFVEAVDSATVGSKMPRAEWDHIGTLRVPVPTPELQEAIVDYLDRETARIDALIAATEQVLALLAERRGAIIARAVTRGLDPDTPLRNFGAPWLEEIPAHWETWKLGHLGRVGNGSTPSRSDGRYWTGGTIPWLNSGVVNQGDVTSSEQYVTQTALNECHLPLLRPGTVLIAIIGQGKTRGLAAVLSMEATVNQNLGFIDPNRELLNPQFLRWWLFAAYPFLRSMSDDARGPKGVLTCEDLADLRIALPPPKEQAAIVDHIEREVERVTAASDATERTIDLLKERRVALISAAVTGQVDAEAAS